MALPTSRGFLSRSTKNFSRNPITRPLLAQFNPREVLLKELSGQDALMQGLYTAISDLPV